MFTQNYYPTAIYHSKRKAFSVLCLHSVGNVHIYILRFVYHWALVSLTSLMLQRR